jgi:hypothetical protein
MKNLKKISLLLLMIGILLSCNERNEENLIQSVERVKIDSVKIAQDSMGVFTTQTIKTYSNFKSKCEGFYGYDYLHIDEFSRSVSSFKFKTEGECGEDVARASQINFRPQSPGKYVFKFWNGKNAAGENIWIQKTIVVE